MGTRMVDYLDGTFLRNTVGLILGCLLLGGCVMTEKYEAEKARSLNFQRLLAQEEKRTSELDSEVKRTKREFAEVDARNRELTAQVQAAREQMGRVQEEADAMKEAMLLERKAKDQMRGGSSLKARKHDPLPELPLDIPPDETSAIAAAPLPGGSTPMIHTVRPGETLFRIGRKYGVDADKIKKWNRLPDDIIEVGQKLIVGQE